MNANHALPPELQPDAQFGTSARELASTWALAADASPLAAMDAPSPARMRTIAHNLAVHAGNRRLQQRHRYYLALAAGVVLLIAAGLFVASRPVHLIATAALDARLPDGSAVFLAPKSELIYRRQFGRSHRQLTMKGTVLFDVRTGDVPFVVLTPDLRVTVLGTKFSVDTAGQESVVFVTDGTVEVSRNGHVQRLAGGEGIRVNAGSSDFTAFTAEDAAAPNLFIHIKQPLGVMFDAVEDIFEVEIMAEDHIRQHVHNFKHEITTVDALINDLCRSVTSMKLRYRSTATGFEILEEE